MSAPACPRARSSATAAATRARRVERHSRHPNLPGVPPKRNREHYIQVVGSGVQVPSRAPGGHGTEGFLPDLLARASHTLTQGFAEELRERGTSLPVWRVLAALHASPGQTVTALAAACLLQQPTTTKLLDRMARDGLVARAPDARDRRVVRVALTADGDARAAELVAAAGRYEAEVLARHPRAEGIRTVLRDIIAGSGPAPQAGGGEGARGEGA